MRSVHPSRLGHSGHSVAEQLDLQAEAEERLEPPRVRAQRLQMRSGSPAPASREGHLALAARLEQNLPEPLGLHLVRIHNPRDTLL